MTFLQALETVGFQGLQKRAGIKHRKGPQADCGFSQLKPEGAQHIQSHYTTYGRTPLFL
ncbi:hypothetical protein ACYULU_02200 [Breznakiellaceae bacterium SP9]